MQERPVYHSQTATAGLDVQAHKVLRNTYMLLAMTIAFSAVCAFATMAMNLGRGPALIMSLAALAIVWLVLPRTQNSASGIWTVFLFTGLLGGSLGPMLNAYLSLANGPSLIMQALGGTAFIFFGLSGYVLTTKKDFSFLGGFLMAGLLVVIACAVIFFVAGFFGVHVPGVHLAISAAIMLLMSGFILFDTSRIINGGETNYIRATVSLYLNIYNIFTSLLHLLGAMDD